MDIEKLALKHYYASSEEEHVNATIEYTIGVLEDLFSTSEDDCCVWNHQINNRILKLKQLLNG